ncbi:MAG: class I tRNA ligase family protein, partial [Patescibacteria group bacterium]
AAVFEPDLKKAKNPFYNLMMFPYPSAEGLHIGSVRTFTGVDIYGRYKRMQGKDVFEPIGLDGFGIHSENFALKTKRHPARLARVTEKNFYRQLEMIGNGFAWNEKLETYDPAYYKWTQWIFTEMFRRGLAYRKKQEVNWCPSCLTVLADEQVIGGECERCGTKVVKKELEQWFFRITNYAERLLNNLDKLDWSEKIKIAQRNWIGRSEGALIKFPLRPTPYALQPVLEVFTTRPDTLFGATFLVISPELAKKWIDDEWRASKEVQKYVEESLAARAKENNEKKEKTGIFSGIYAINPANQEKIPVWISDYVLAGYGTGAVMAVPAHDERDFEFAKKFNLP